MKNTLQFKSILLFCVMVLSCGTLFAQEAVTEPDFVGEAMMLLPDNTVVRLEKSTIQEKTRMNAGAIIVGIGAAKTKITIDGTSARVRIPEEGDYKIIVKAVDNNTDPLSIISVFRFDVKKKERRAEVASVNSFGSRTNNKLDFLPFHATRYGNSSYLLVLEEKPAGEYGIIVRNPNALNEAATIVATFAID